MQKAFKKTVLLLLERNTLSKKTRKRKKETFIEKTFYFSGRTGCYRKEYSINA